MDRRADYEDSKPRVDRCGRCGLLFSGTRCPVCRASIPDFEAIETARADLPWMPAYDDGE